MRTREVINSMTDKELSDLFCNLIESVADKVEQKADINSMCDLCPVSKTCVRGKSGFATLLESEATGKVAFIQ